MLHTDVSEMDAGAVLTQIHEGYEQVIAYASHRSSRPGKRAATQHELMAVLWAMGHFRSYLWARQLTLVTHDCSSLTWLFRNNDLSSKFHRWSLRFTEYDMML